MADTYAFSLLGALLLAMTLTPVLCMFLFKEFKPVAENLLVRFLKSRYLWQLRVCLKYRWTTVIVMCGLIGYTASLLPKLGREFMPELEEGNLWIRGTLPLNVTLERQVEISRQARRIMATYPEVDAIVAQLGRPDDGTDTAGFYNSEYFVPLRAEKDWPLLVEQTGWRSWLWGSKRARTKTELVNAMNKELETTIPGAIWNFSQNIRDNVMEAMSGIKGDNSVKIFGPEIDQLEMLATKVKNELQKIDGIENVGVFHIRGQSHLEFRVDPAKCERYGVLTNDVNNVVSSALGANALSYMVEGEKLFPIAVRWPLRLRDNETSILDIPVDVLNNQVVLVTGPTPTPNASGTGRPDPAKGGSLTDTSNPITLAARIRLRELVSPVGEDGSPNVARYRLTNGSFDWLRKAGVPEAVLTRLDALKDQEVATSQDFLRELRRILDTDEFERFKSRVMDQAYQPQGSFERAGASDIYREDGKRMIAVKFSVRGRDLGGAVDEAREKTKQIPELRTPYRTVWSGEFEEMEDANSRLLIIIPLSLGLIFVLLYMAFRSFIDAVVVFTNVFDLAVGGIWALYLTDTNFSISAAVGFVSLFGVAIMEGILMISYFNALRARGWR